MVVSHMISQNYRFDGRRVLDFMLNVAHTLVLFALLGLICLRKIFVPRPFVMIHKRHFTKEK